MKISFHREDRPKIDKEMEHFFEKEENLIRSEFYKKNSDVDWARMAFFVSGIFFVVGAVYLAMALMMLLETAISSWQASGIVALLFLTGGGFLLGGAMKKVDGSKSRPVKSLETLNDLKHSILDKFHTSTKH